MLYDTKMGGYELIDLAAELIRRDEVVAFPTETVYGLGGNALSDVAIQRIYEAKNRPKDNPFIVHVTSLEQADRVAYVTDDAEVLFKAFAPGPITVVLKKRDCIPYSATAGLDTVGIRMPSHPMARTFIDACGLPIAAPSANLSKRVSPTKANYVYDDMAGRVPLILDGGDCEVGIESTVISLAGDVPTVLRPGIVTVEKLMAVLPAVKTFSGEVKVAPAPGMKYTHYAPTALCYGFERDESALSYVKNNSDKSVVILCKGEAGRFSPNKAISLGKDGTEIAHNVFSAMRECERQYDVILLQMLSSSGEEGAVMNRILKSCGGKVLS
ncbi:MAG: threonylcarbamoyl-AMP synthase [Clostridia bacterium]|nr:threonylcarbamoyl-AMP synthase [Clostridia bacterium]